MSTTLSTNYLACPSAVKRPQSPVNAVRLGQTFLQIAPSPATFPNRLLKFHCLAAEAPSVGWKLHRLPNGHLRYESRNALVLGNVNRKTLREPLHLFMTSKSMNPGTIPGVGRWVDVFSKPGMHCTFPQLGLESAEIRFVRYAERTRLTIDDPVAIFQPLSDVYNHGRNRCPSRN